MFLRGPDGLKSANLAIDVLQEKSEETLKLFMLGVRGFVELCYRIVWDYRVEYFAGLPVVYVLYRTPHIDRVGLYRLLVENAWEQNF